MHFSKELELSTFPLSFNFLDVILSFNKTKDPSFLQGTPRFHKVPQGTPLSSMNLQGASLNQKEPKGAQRNQMEPKVI